MRVFISLTFENDQSNLNDNSSLSDSLVPSNGDIAVASVTYQNYFVYYGTGNGFIAGPSVTTESRPHGIISLKSAGKDPVPE